MAASETTRRSVFVATAALAALATPAIAVAADHSDLFAEADRIKALRGRMNAGDPSPALSEEWETAELAFLRKVEALPLTRPNVDIRARAVGLIYDDDFNQLAECHEDAFTTDTRLMIQVMRTLAGAV